MHCFEKPNIYLKTPTENLHAQLDTVGPAL